MREVAGKSRSRRKLVFDNESNRIVLKDYEEGEEEAESLNFDPEEVRHFGGISVDDIFSLLQIICTALGGAKIVIELAKLWVEDRKGRKVIVKKGDVEIEIQGGISYDELQEKIELFKHLSKESQRDEVKIIIP